LIIDRILVTHHTHTLEVPFPPSWDSRPRKTFSATLVRVYTVDGAVGVGSGDAMYGFEDYAELFLGHEVSDLERHAAVLENVGFHAGRCWPLDMALWDLEGLRQGKPVYQLLGGRADKVRAYVSSGVHRSPEEMAEVALRFVEQGFPAMKVRLGRKGLEKDLEVLRAVRNAVGDRLELMVDCNQGWRMPWDTAEPWNLAEATALAERLEELNVYWMEEPLHRSDLDGMAALRKKTKMRIAGAEMTREFGDLMNLVKHDCLDVLQPDVVLSGGFLGLKKLAEAAEKKGMMLTPHTWGNGIGLLGNAHLTAGATNATFLEFPFDPPEWTYEGRDFMLEEPVKTNEQGWIQLTEEPGFGIKLNEERLNTTEVWQREYHR